MAARHPEVVIVGAGIVGASVAWHLAQLGCREVLILERGAAAGAGSTGRATGGFRAQFGSEIGVRLSLLARQKLRRFAEEVGADPGYRPCGYLFLATSGAELAALGVAARRQRGWGLEEVELLEPEDVARVNPALAGDAVAGGSFCPSDGFVRPLEIARGYLAAAERLGVRVEFGEECVGLEVEAAGDGGPRRIAGVRTRSRLIPSRRVVNAAGPWAAPLAALAGLEIPVRPLRRHVAATVPTDALPEAMPMTIWIGDGFHLRVRDGRVLLLRPRPDELDSGFDDRFDRRFLEGLHDTAAERVPCLAGVPIDPARSWAGLYEMSPDRHALLGEAPGLAGLFLANGSSGHGVMHAPALGQLLAERILSGSFTTLDAAPLSPARFAQGRLNPDSGWL
ncbi:MAG TPA: FAD-dependent oxidoreductase [Thermoanaerobaculia bacterium]|nr:FAD-dependent oxidoreductase [Thermoanaerobaculia bacterium]